MNFFSPEDFEKYPPCGMFNLSHILSALVCFIIIGLCCYKLKDIGKNKVIKFIRILSIIVTILEIVKIGYNFYYGYFELTNWLPFAFCSLFIYALWISGYSKGKIRDIGFSFLICGCIVCGTAFIIMPSTSLTLHPLFHYLCIYSLLFHSLMVIVGVISYTNGLLTFNKKTFNYYAIFCGVCMVIALILNFSFGENLMFLNDPYNIPIPLLKIISENILPLYILIISSVYIFAPYFISMFICNKIIGGNKKC